MSIERQSRNSGSSLRKFLDEHMPGRRDIAHRWRTQLLPCDDVHVEGNRAHLGQALELRIRLDLPRKLPYIDVLGFLPVEQCRQLLRGCGFESLDTPQSLVSPTTDPMLRVWTRTSHPIDVDDDGRAALDAVLLATELEEVVHRKLTANVQQQRVLFAAMLDIRTNAATVPYTDSGLLPPLEHLWRGYLATGRAGLQPLGERVLISPQIVPGFATADLVVGLTLVEIKTYAQPAPHLDAWLDQLLGYLLVDRWDTLRIKQLALYCGWQATTLTATVDEVLKTSAAGRPSTLPELRHTFHEVLRDELDEADRRYQQKRFPMPAEAIRPPEGLPT